MTNELSPDDIARELEICEAARKLAAEMAHYVRTGMGIESAHARAISKAFTAVCDALRARLSSLPPSVPVSELAELANVFLKKAEMQGLGPVAEACATAWGSAAKKLTQLALKHKPAAAEAERGG